jgi:hypothetical protein
MAEDLKNTLIENAQGPAEVESDSVRVRQHSLKDQIAAAKYLKQQAGSPLANVRRTKITPGGAV